MQCTKSSYVSTSTSSFSSWSARVSVLNVAKKTHPGAAGIEFPNNSPKSGFHSNCAHMRIHACRIITHFNLCWRLRWETLTKKISFPCKLLSVTGNGLGLFSKAAFSEHLCITITCCVAKIIWRKGKALVARWDFAHLKKKKVMSGWKMSFVFTLFCEVHTVSGCPLPPADREGQATRIWA